MPQDRAFGRESDYSEARLRPMAASDVGPLVDLWVISWREAMPDIAFDGRRDWIAAFLQDPARRTFVADSARGSVGFVTLEGHHLHQLVVAVSAKGSGIASRLLDLAKEDTGGLTLDVNQANARAVRFYEREGFRRTGSGVNETSGLAIWAMRWTTP